MKRRFSVVLFLVFCIIATGIFCVYGKNPDESVCREFLSCYGWEVAETTDSSAEVKIPGVFDRVYENYNEIQKTSGLDLLPYRGKSGTRYTFVVTNYPYDTGETVYANVIVIEGIPVAGDIMTVSLSGFMHGLGENLPR